MRALIALEFLLLRRGSRAALPFTLMFIPILGTALFSRETIPLQALGSVVLLPALFLTLSGMVTLNWAEPLAWLVPVRKLARIQARFWLFAGLGALHAALILVFHAATGNTPREPWVQLALHSWLCFMGSSLLLFTLADLARAQHVFIRTLAFLIGIAPGNGIVVAHVVSGTPAWVLAVEAAVVAGLLGLNLLIHRDLEPAGRAPEPGESTPVPPPREPSPARELRPDPLAPAASPARPTPLVLSPPASLRLDHVADPGPVLFGSLFSYMAIWLLLIGWLTTSFVAVPFVYLGAGFVFLSGIFQQVLRHWAPFQASPISRKTVLRRLFIPVLLLWLVTLGIQSGTTWYENPTVLKFGGNVFDLPFIKRECDEFLPPQLQGNAPIHLRALPSSPGSVAPLMSQALRLSYGIEVPPDEILAVHLPVPPDKSEDWIRSAWLRDVENRWEGPIRRKLLQWRIAAGLLLLLAGLISVSTILRGSLPRWLTQTFQWLLAALFMIPACWTWIAPYLPRLPRPLHALYADVFDRPWILIAVLLPLTVLILIRHARVFCAGGLELPRIKKQAAGPLGMS